LAVAFGILVMLGAWPAPSGALIAAGAVTAVAVVVLAWASRQRAAQVAAVSLVATALASWWVGSAVWLAPAVLLCAAVAYRDRALRQLRGDGRVRLRLRDLGVGLVIGVAAAGVLRAYLVRDGPATLVVAGLPTNRAGALLTILVFSLANALAEELVWRGAVMDLTRPLGVAPAASLSAVSFGVAHLHGIPSGPAGVALASTFGAVLALTVLWRGSIVPAVIAHLTIDVLIGVVVFL
jgi:membrane protease YdiL (CAAX protease family)